MRIYARTASAILLMLAGCAGDSPSTVAQPIALSPSEAQLAAFAEHRRVVEQAAGAYVRVVVFGANDNENFTGPATAVVNAASGVIVDPEGHIVTAAHIAVDSRYRAKITTMDGACREGRILHVDRTRELALLKIEPFPDLQAARIAGTPQVRRGQTVFTVGTPENRQGVVSFGRITEPRSEQRVGYDIYGYDDAIALEMDIRSGHSGGPLFDTEGRLVGMIASFGLGESRKGLYLPTRVGYAVPSAGIVAYLDEVLER